MYWGVNMAYVLSTERMSCVITESMPEYIMSVVSIQMIFQSKDGVSKVL